MTDLDVVLSGGASNCVGLTAAAFALQKKNRIARIAGTSAGSLGALSIAFGLSADDAKRLFLTWLQQDRLLDGSPLNVPSRFGYCAGESLRKALSSTLGKDAKLGDAFMPVFVVVTDMYESKPVVLSSWDHPNVSAVDAGVASSAMLPVFGAQTIRGLDRGNRLYFDGGFSRNFAMDVFDDVPSRPTVGVRVKNKQSVEPVRAWEFLKAAKAVGRAMLYSSDNAYMSAKPNATVIDVDGGDGLDFSLESAEIERRWACGWAAGLRYNGNHVRF